MKKIQNFLLLGIFLLSASFLEAQEKKQPLDVVSTLSNIVPDVKTEFWALVFNEYGRNKEVKISGKKTEYVPQFSGFNLRPGYESFYYIVYSSQGKLNYITEIKDLKEFIGKVDNVHEAALSAVLEGYLIDESFIDVASNYYDDKANYYLDLGKITSQECPYQKKHFTLTVSKSNGQITNVKENGTYIEVYNKKCKNNPRLLKIEKKEEPKDESKKQPAKKR